MQEQVTVEEETQVVSEAQEEVIDGRTLVGKLQTKVQKLEDTQEKILLTLAEHQKRIDECSIRR